MSNAFMALIWWVIPLAGLLGALGYVLWVTQFKSKFESETTRSVGQFQRFQDSFRDAEITTFVAGDSDSPTDTSTDTPADGSAGDTTSSD